MITQKQFAQRVGETAESGGIVELPDDMIELVTGAGPGDFHDVFNDSHVEGGVGPTFQDLFTDVYPYGDSAGFGGGN